VPDLEQMTAFLLDGSAGVCMRRGCWHDHFPLVDGGDASDADPALDAGRF